MSSIKERFISLKRLSIVFFVIAILTDLINSKVIIRSPKELREKFINGTIEVNYANFGRIPYGYNIIGKIIYDPVDKDKDYACKELPPVGDKHKVDESPIIMVHRGDCSFVTKVKNVEKAGGHVALIIDNTNESLDDIIMADDGRGRELTIPGVLMSKKDGKIITDYIAKNQDKKLHLIFEVDFEMEHASNTVKYDIYTTADNEDVYKLLDEFMIYHLTFKDSVNLTMHYVTYQHPLYDWKDKSKNINRENCFGKGKYCATPGNFGVKDGNIVIGEAIRQKCIYNIFHEEGAEEMFFWDYMIEFYVRCLNQTKPDFTNECAAGIQKEFNLPQDKINLCIRQSFTATKEELEAKDFETMVDNRLLDEDNESREEYLLNFIPSITINGRTFMGSWKGYNLFEAICAGFKKKPQVCYDFGAFKREPKMNHFWLVLIILLIIAVNVVIFCLCKNYIRKKIVERIESTDINHKINTVVTSYLALRETKA